METPSIAVPEELVDFIEGGRSILVATADADVRPEAVRASGAIVSADRRRLTILVPAATGARTRRNLERGSAIAVTFNRPVDHRSIQLKGRCVAVREAGPAEEKAAHDYRAAFVEALYLVGMSRSVVRRFAVWPAFVAEVEVHAIFQQTPGPHAGEPLSARGMGGR